MSNMIKYRCKVPQFVLLLGNYRILMRRHDIQHKDTLQNDIYHNDRVKIMALQYVYQ
jgi:hypothetical protein